jgi:DNA-directed RNA polymerase subunit beta'
MKYRGTVCEKCGVEVTTSKVRRERMGHIDLAAPVVHIWFLKSPPSRICKILDVKLKGKYSIESVLAFDKYLVKDPGITDFRYHQVISEYEYNEAVDKFGPDSFVAGMGAEIIQQILRDIDLKVEQKLLRNQLSQPLLPSNRNKIVKRLKVVEDFLESDNKLEWMVMDVLPVIPPDLRPLVMLDGGRFATYDLNELYRRVLNRNNRLQRLKDLRAPDIIIRNEKRMLQGAVDTLFDNSRQSKIVKSSSNKRPLKSLTDMLKGKHGRFRQNLLGKRVDYSGRSVIVVGPELKLHQCGIPKKNGS